MNKLVEFGRKALFYVRVLSGYEERRIRSFRLQLENHLKQIYSHSGVYDISSSKAQERKATLNKVPEQIILSEVRRMVEEMQALNKKLEDTEAAVEEYFKPIDEEAEIIMKMQLEGKEKTSEEMLKAMEQQALLEQVEAEKISAARQLEKFHANQNQSSTSTLPEEASQVLNAKS